MENKLSSIIESQSPEYLRQSAPLLIGFLETYYAYAQQRKNSVGLVQYTVQEKDIDLTLDENVSRFYALYGQYLPLEMAFDKRNFIKLLNSVYEAKGTEKSFKLLFRALFGVEIDIFKPEERILRASDGQWQQESFITIQKTFGSEEFLYGIDIPVTNSFGDYTFKALRIESIGANIYRIFYIASSPIKFERNKTIEIMNSDSNIVFKCNIVDTPSNITVVQAGLNFQVGQIFKFSESATSTIFKITSVDAFGAIKSVQILSYGKQVLASTEVYISSYRAAPPTSGNSIVSTETSPGVFTYDIVVFDTIINISEYISAYDANQDLNSYFLEDYVDESYSGAIIFEQSLNTGTVLISESIDNSSTITLQQYINSRAKVKLEVGDVSKLPGRYIGNKGQLSDQSMRLQDNYYYQVFSYVVNSQIDISRYKDSVLKILHPAGLKSFAAIQKSEDVNIYDQIVADVKYTFRVDVNDVVDSSDIIARRFGLNKTDSSNTSDSVIKSVGLVKTDSSVSTDSTFRSNNKNVSDSTTTSDASYKTAALSVDDDISALFTYSDTYFAEDYTDSSSITDSTTISAS
jgi:hypothetical protein